MKKYITGAIMGGVIVATAYLGVVFFKQIKMINQHEVVLVQIVNFINQAQQANQPAVNQ